MKGFAVLVLAILLPATAPGQSIPSAASERLVKNGELFVQALNSDSAAFRARTVSQIYSSQSLLDPGEERLLEQLDRVARMYAPLDYHHTELVARSVHVYARSGKAQRWLDFQFRFEPETPFKLAQLVFVAEVSEPVYLPNGDIGQRETLEWLSSYIDKLVAADDLYGSILIARGDQAIYERVFGFADARHRRMVTVGTRFNLGSGNKMLTALSIMILASQGKLNLSDPVGRYLPDFPDYGFQQKATIRHLLSHTSGTDDYLTAEYKKHWGKFTELVQVLPYVYDDSLQFAPGASYHYSNSGYLLAGLIVEKASGRNYFDFVREHIYEPLGMKKTDSYLRNDTTANLAYPLTREGKAWKVAPIGLRGTSAGGGYSTTRDMLRFVRGFVDGKIVSSATAATMLAPGYSDPELSSGYGLGFMLWESPGGRRSFGHEGIAPGVNSLVRYFPDQDLTLVIFSNQDNGAYDDLRKNTVKLITGER